MLAVHTHEDLSLTSSTPIKIGVLQFLHHPVTGEVETGGSLELASPLHMPIQCALDSERSFVLIKVEHARNRQLVLTFSLYMHVHIYLDTCVNTYMHMPHKNTNAYK